MPSILVYRAWVNIFWFEYSHKVTELSVRRMAGVWKGDDSWKCWVLCFLVGSTVDCCFLLLGPRSRNNFHKLCQRQLALVAVEAHVIKRHGPSGGVKALEEHLFDLWND